MNLETKVPIKFWKSFGEHRPLQNAITLEEVCTVLVLLVSGGLPNRLTRLSLRAPKPRGRPVASN